MPDLTPPASPNQGEPPAAAGSITSRVKNLHILSLSTDARSRHALNCFMQFFVGLIYELKISLEAVEELFALIRRDAPWIKPNVKKLELTLVKFVCRGLSKDDGLPYGSLSDRAIVSKELVRLEVAAEDVAEFLQHTPFAKVLAAARSGGLARDTNSTVRSVSTDKGTVVEVAWDEKMAALLDGNGASGTVATVCIIETTADGRRRLSMSLASASANVAGVADIVGSANDGKAFDPDSVGCNQDTHRANDVADDAGDPGIREAGVKETAAVPEPALPPIVVPEGWVLVNLLARSEDLLTLFQDFEENMIAVARIPDEHQRNIVQLIPSTPRDPRSVPGPSGYSPAGLEKLKALSNRRRAVATAHQQKKASAAAQVSGKGGVVAGGTAGGKGGAMSGGTAGGKGSFMAGGKGGGKGDVISGSAPRPAAGPPTPAGRAPDVGMRGVAAKQNPWRRCRSRRQLPRAGRRVAGRWGPSRPARVSGPARRVRSGALLVRERCR